MKIEIEKVSNGYIIRSGIGVEVAFDLDKVFKDLLSTFEGRSSFFTGDSYGEVIIKRSKEKPNE